jgi:hypothetical protein
LIRPAVVADIPAILRMGRAFFEQAGWPAFAEWHEPSVDLTLRGFIAGTIPGGLLAAEDGDQIVGMAAFMVFPFYFNLATSVGQEIFWWVEPAYRSGVGMQMLDALENAARAQGAGVFIMASVSGLRDAALARIYSARGYRPAENTFIKKLS